MRIQELPFQALLLLVETQGRIVTKSELQNRLWGINTFVEVDPNLYVIIGKLRDLLEDDAVAPQFIKTVSGRGYQFIGATTRVSRVSTEALNASETEPANSPEATTNNQALPLIDPSQASAQVGGSSETATFPFSIVIRHMSSSALGWLSLFLVMGLATVIVMVLRIRHETVRPIYSASESLMIAGPDDKTQSAPFGQMLPFLVKLKIQQSPYLTLLPDSRIAAMKRDASYSGRDGDLRVCSALGGNLLLTSQATVAGRGYRVDLTALRCSDGKPLDTQHADADSEASLLSAVDIATERMRQRLGESAGSIQRFDIPLVASTTLSLGALKKFTEGEGKLEAGNALGAGSDFKMAVDLDPAFALAYARLGALAMNSQQPVAGAEYIRKAFELRERVSDRERLYIAGHYYTDVTGDLQHAIATYELWTTLYPRDWGPYNNLTNLYDLLGNPEKAVGYARIAAQMNPNPNFAATTLSQAYLELGDHKDLSSLCKSPAQAGNAFISFHNICFLGAYTQRDEAEMQRQLAWAKGHPQESLILGSSASTALAGGRLRMAQQALAAARENALQNHNVEITTMMELNQAGADAEYGSPHDAIRTIQNALKTAQNDIEARTLAAMVLAVASQDKMAQKMAAAASQEAPDNDAVVRIGSLTVKAIIALHEHRASAAVDALEVNRPFFLSPPTKFMPAYYLGIAYLENKQLDKAAETFRWILKNREIAQDSIYVGLSALSLGRTLALEGKSQDAAQAYDQAIHIWQDADADFAPLKQANAARSLLSLAARQ